MGVDNGGVSAEGGEGDKCRSPSCCINDGVLLPEVMPTQCVCGGGASDDWKVRKPRGNVANPDAQRLIPASGWVDAQNAPAVVCGCTIREGCPGGAKSDDDEVNIHRRASLATGLCYSIRCLRAWFG